MNEWEFGCNSIYLNHRYLTELHVLTTLYVSQKVMHFLRPVKCIRALLLLQVYVLGIFLNLSHTLNQILEMFELWLDSSVSSEYNFK